MAAEKLTIHVPPEATPQNVTQLIESIARDEISFGSVNELMDYAMKRGIGNRSEMQFMALQLGLLGRFDDGFVLTRTGYDFAQLKDAIKPDVLHFLLYSAWGDGREELFYPSWSYRACCNDYWQAKTVELSSTYLDSQVTEIINRAEASLTQETVEYDSVSFSRKSIRGIRNWLEALDPPVIIDGCFQRRDFCHPELFLLALGYMMRDEPDAVGVDILLSHERRQIVCQVCLLDPEAFDSTLDWMLPLYPHVVSADPDVGYYGRYIRLHHLPTLEDLPR
ncbi:MAG: hypothetical protein NZ750_12470 [Anaerolineae bacterium]|nr:hypothetical protein [Anaerolineae bacterium]MDW8171279.1 hypothetical protein [Anaerolineae bacterium]